MISNRIHYLSILILIFSVFFSAQIAFSAPVQTETEDTEVIRSLPSLGKLIQSVGESTGISGFIKGQAQDWTLGIGRVIMIIVGSLLLYLGIVKRFEPLLLVTISFGNA